MISFRDSKNSFLFNVLQDDGGDQGKLEAFINFCEDTIFEVSFSILRMTLRVIFSIFCLSHDLHM